MTVVCSLPMAFASSRLRSSGRAARLSPASRSSTPEKPIALDETGKQMTSLSFAAKLGRARDEGISDTAFVIGGPDGLDPAFLASASLTLSLGTMTWPHQMARIMAAEQIYRAMTILSGHPYHRD